MVRDKILLGNNTEGFLRALPRALALEERLLLDAVWTSWCVVDTAFSRLRQTLQKIGGEDLQPISLTQEERSELAIYAWTIIDNLHNLRLFVRQLSIAGTPPLVEFLEGSDIARRLRNLMDHRSQTLSNEAKRKSADPVFGVLTFMSPELPGGRWAVHQIALSGAHYEEHAFPSIDTWARPTRDMSSIGLAAFGKFISFSEVMGTASSAMAGISEWAEAVVTEAVNQHSKVNGLESSAVLSEVSGLTVCVSAQFGPLTP